MNVRLILAILGALVAVPLAASDSFTSAPALPVPAYGHAAVWDGSGFLLFGGSAASGHLDTILRFDPATGVATDTGHHLPQGLAHAAAVWDGVDRPATGCPGGCAYVFGGGVVDNLPWILRYNPASGAVVTMGATIPEGGSHFPAVWDARDRPAWGCADGCAYLFGGNKEGATPVTNRILRYNPATDTLTTLPATLFGTPIDAAAFWDARDRLPAGCPGGCAYIVGGVLGTERIQEFNVDKGVVSITNAYYPYDGAAVAWTGTHAYLLGGTNGDNFTSPPNPWPDTVWRFDPDADATVRMAATVPRHDRWTGGFDGEDGWAFGGLTSTNARLATASRYSFEPLAPAAPAAAIGPGGLDATLTWTAPAANGHAGPIVGYDVYRNGALAAALGNVLSYHDTGLAKATTYTWNVAARSGDGAGALSPGTTRTTPDTPSQPLAFSAVRSATDGAVDLAWQPPATDGGRAVNGYRVHRDGVPVATLGVATAWTDTGRAAGATHTYRVAATSVVGEGAPSAPATVRVRGPPSTPLDLAVSPGPGLGELRLSWSAPADDGGEPVAGYHVYRDGAFATATAATSASDAGLADGATHSYRVAAVSALGEGEATTPAEGTTYAALPPAAVPTLVAAARVHAADLAWDPPAANAGQPATGYRVFRDGVPVQDLGLATAWRDAGLAGGATHVWTVAALNDVGAGPHSPQASATTHTAALPSAPGLEPPAASPGAVALSWSAAAVGDGAPVSAYRVWRGASADALALRAVVTEDLSFSDAPLSPGATFHYAVSAENEAGEGPRSAVLAATVPATPGAPAGLVAAGALGAVDLAWTGVDDGGSPVTAWRLAEERTLRVRDDDGTFETTYTPDGDDGDQVKRLVLGSSPVASATLHVHARATYCNGNVVLRVNGVVTATVNSCAGWSTAGSWASFAIPAERLLPGATNSFALRSGCSPTCIAISLDTERDLGRTDAERRRTVCAYTCWTEVTTYPGEMLAWLETRTPVATVDLAPAARAHTLATGPNVTLSATLSALNAVGQGPPSPASATSFRTPGAPSSLVASPGPDGGEVTLSWTAPAADGGTAVTGYRVVRAVGGSFEERAVVASASTWTDEGLRPNETWTYRVEALNAVGAGFRSAAATALTFDLAHAPAAGAARGPAVGEVSFAWTPPADTGGAPVAAWRLRVTSDEGAAVVSQDHVAAPGDARGAVNLYADGQTLTKQLLVDGDALARGLEARFHVYGTGARCGSTADNFRFAVNGVSVREFEPCRHIAGYASGWATFPVPLALLDAGTATFTLTKTSGGSANGYLTVAIDDAVDLDRTSAWSGAVAGEAVAYLEIVASTAPPQTFETTATSLTLTGLAPGEVRHARVAALTAAGEGWPSSRATAAAFDVPSAVRDLAATPGPGMGEVSLAWTAPGDDGGVAVSGYRLLRDGVPVALLGDVRSAQDSGLADGATHAWTVRAVNSVGDGDEAAPAVATAWTDSVPAAPHGLAALAGPRGGETALAWTAPAGNGGPPVTGYRVYRDGAPVATPTAEALAESGLAFETTYSYAVAAVNLRGEGAPSAAVDVLTFNDRRPEPPASTAVTPGPANGEATLTWLAPAPNGGAPTGSYVVYRGLAADALAPLGATVAASFVDAGLAADTRYWYAVAAVNAEGEGAASDLVSTFTSTPPLKPAYAGASAVWTGRYAFAFGGEDEFGALAQIVRHDPATGASSTMASTLPTPRAYTAAVWDGRYAYVVGGSDGFRGLDEIVRFDPQLDLVEVVGRLPTPRSHVAAVWADDRVLAFGGLGDDLRGIGEVLEWLPGTATARPALGSSSLPRVWGAQVVRDSGANYLAGGCYEAECPSDTVLRHTYVPGSSASFGYEWDTLPDRVLGHAVAFDGANGFILGGVDDDGRTLAAVTKVDAPASSWTRMARTLPTPREGGAAVWTGTDLVVLGGRGCPGLCDGPAKIRFVASAPTAAGAPLDPGRAEILWTAPASNTYSSLTAFRVYRVEADGAETLVATTASGSSIGIVIAGQPAGLNTYRVRALDLGVNEGLSSNDARVLVLGTEGLPEPPAEETAVVEAPVGGAIVTVRGFVEQWDNRTTGAKCKTTAPVSFTVALPEGVAAFEAAGTCQPFPDEYVLDCVGEPLGRIECAWTGSTQTSRAVLHEDGRFTWDWTYSTGRTEVRGVVTRACAGACA